MDEKKTISIGKVTVDTKDLDVAIAKFQKIRSLIEEINDLLEGIDSFADDEEGR